MFGTYRYILAIMVAIAHLAPIYMVHTGIYAVLAFFTLSGYLMTLVLDTHYLNYADGIKKYYLNRILRVAPSYYVVLALSLVIVIYTPLVSSHIHERMNLPQTAGDWIDNIFIFPLTDIAGQRSSFNLVPPTWSLSIELVFWMLMPFLIRPVKMLYIWAGFAVIYSSFVALNHSSLHLRYYSILAGSLPFLLGSIIYFLNRKKAKLSPSWGLAVMFITLFYFLSAPWLFGDKLYFTAKWYDSSVLYEGFYVAILLNFATIYMLSRLDLTKIPAKIIKIDSFMGNLAYPVFLLHIFSAIVMVVISDSQCQTTICGRGWQLFWISFPLLNMLAVILWFSVERQVSYVRNKVKNI